MIISIVIILVYRSVYFCFFVVYFRDSAFYLFQDLDSAVLLWRAIFFSKATFEFGGSIFYQPTLILKSLLFYSVTTIDRFSSESRENKTKLILLITAGHIRNRSKNV